MPHRHILPALLVLSALLAPAAGAVAPKGGAQLPPHVPDELIVNWREGVDLVARDAQMVRLGADVGGPIGRRGAQRLKLGRGADLRAAIARLKASGLVESVSPNWIHRKLETCASIAAPKVCPNDAEFAAGHQYAAHDDEDNDMDLPQAWGVVNNSNGVLITIADDGFRLTHEDLVDLQAGTSCTSNPCSGTAAAQGANEDHGSYVAGAAAGRANNAVGIAGPAFDSNVLPIRLGPVFTDEILIRAYDYAAAHNADVLNLSLGGPGFGQAEFDAIDAIGTAGGLVVAAAGNEDSNTDRAVAAYPANYDLANVIAVAASDFNDGLASWSTWGSTRVDLAAPGQTVRSSENSANDGYGYVSGTSFSAPYTTGVAALIGQRLIDLGYGPYDYHELRALLIAGADVANDNGPLPLRGRVAAGRVNAANSIAKAAALNAGTLGAVLVVDSIGVDDDPLIGAGNDGDDLVDAGETVHLVVTLRNDWQASGAVSATLSSTDPAVTVTGPNANYANIPAFGSGTANFEVAFPGIVGNQSALFRLDLVPASGAAQTRYFYYEVASLQNSVEVVQAIGRDVYDEFHAWHVNVPVGATNVVFETHTNGGIDIDLLARRDATPEYMISLDVDPDSGGQTFYAGAEDTNPAIVSGEADGEELIGDPSKPSTDISGTQSGNWHLVVINYDQVFASYRVKASWDDPGAGTIRFNAATATVNESAGTITIGVVRSGGVGAVSASYTTANGTATAGTDYTTTAGTLNWANGDTSTKTIIVPLTVDAVDEGAETFSVTLSAPTGGANLGRYQTETVTINAHTAGGGGGGGSGGGGGGGGASDALSLLALGALLAARRRRAHALN